jgi:tRNA threonylcarbamoyladenosine biosynthesis protein TsaE
MTIFDELKSGILSASPAETEDVGARLAAATPADTALALHGDLGAGKTTLVRGIARGLGVAGAVTSPTYNIYTLYQGSSRQLLHVDAYRLHDARDLDNLALEDFLLPPFLIAVEWPGHVRGFLGGFPTRHIRLLITPDHRHLIRLDSR